MAVVVNRAMDGRASVFGGIIAAGNDHLYAADFVLFF